MGKRFYWCLGVSDATDADSSPHSSNDKDSVDATDDCSLHSSNEKVSDTALDINTAHETPIATIDKSLSCVTLIFENRPKRRRKEILDYREFSEEDSVIDGQFSIASNRCSDISIVEEVERNPGKGDVELSICKKLLHENVSKMAAYKEAVRKSQNEAQEKLEAYWQSKVSKLTNELQQSRHEKKNLQKELVRAKAAIAKLQSMASDTADVDTQASAVSLMNELFKKKQSNVSVVNGFLSALMKRKKNVRPIVAFIIAQEEQLAALSTYYGGRRYNELQEKFKPWVCLRELDLVATVSFSGYEVMRKIEFSGEQNAKYLRGLFKSRSELSRLSKLLERHGGTILPYEMTENSVQFDLNRAIPWLLQQYGLWRYVEGGDLVTVAATVDGGELAWQLTQISAGIKICDERAVNPLTGRHQFGESGYDNIQSRHVCFPLYVHIAKDNKDFYSQHLSSFFRTLNEMEDCNPHGLQFSHGADMCSLQKTIKKGGAMKNKNFACYCCNIRKDELAKPNNPKCQDCTARRSPHPCYHHPVSDEELMDRLKNEYEDLLRDYPYLSRIDLKRSRMRCGTDAVRDHRSDYRHIDFDLVNNSVSTGLQFRNLVISELRLREVDPQPGLQANRIDLKELLMIEQRFRILHDIIQSSPEEAMIKLQKAIPCLLHLENRMSDAMITFLLRRGLHLREGDARATQQFMANIENIFNEALFGLPGSPSNWKLPLNPDGTMAPIKLSNWRARRVVQSIDPLVNSAIVDEVEREQWKNVFTLFSRVIEVCISIVCIYLYYGITISHIFDVRLYLKKK